MGVDPVWGLATAKLTFTNGIKMKLSVIMGIIHMTIGVIIKGTNACFKRDLPTLIFEVITGLVMLLGLFGWMDLLIYAKWFFPLDFTDGATVTVDGIHMRQGDYWNNHVPSVINIMITTVFNGGAPTNTDYALFWGYSSFLNGNGDVEWTNTYPIQKKYQSSMYSCSIILLLFALVCVPLMLLVKPLCCRPHHAHVDDHDRVEGHDGDKREYEMVNTRPEGQNPNQVSDENNGSLAINDNDED